MSREKIQSCVGARARKMTRKGGIHRTKCAKRSDETGARRGSRGEPPAPSLLSLGFQWRGDSGSHTAVEWADEGKGALWQ